jgi:hypothetical protein
MSNPSRRWRRRLVRAHRRRLEEHPVHQSRAERALEHDFLANLPERHSGYGREVVT